MIDAATRLQGAEQLIDKNQYFVIHAARQSGKTTYLQDLARRLNKSGQYYALYCSLEGVQGVADPKEGIPAVVRTVKNALEFMDIPLVILFDEADCLSEETLILFLRQLRDGYNSRSYRAFLHSVALVGMRNIRDYKAKARPDSASLGSASPFNIVTTSLTLPNFR
jgi:predicted AAA+ superfamily ATPase